MEWKEIFAKLGILVFETEKVARDEFSGISLYYDESPIIILNGKANHNKRIFSLMHELVHLIQGKSTIGSISPDNEKENFHNKVASEILIPSHTLKDTEIFHKNSNLNLAGISHKYGVSKQTAVYKLNSIGKITNKEKETLLKQILEKNKPQYKDNGILSYKFKKYKYEGKPYTQFILNAYNNKIITSTKLMRYLDIPIDKINSL